MAASVQFKAGVMTNAGAALLNRVQAGECGMIITRGATGDGVYADKSIAAMQALTALVSERQSIDVITATPDGEKSLGLKFIISNRELTSSYALNEIGVFAKSDEVGAQEVLYAVTVVDGDEGITIPPYNGVAPVSIEQNFYITVSNSATVTVNIVDGDYPTIDQFNQLADIVTTHVNATVVGESGVHGIRYYDDELQVNVNGEWEDAGGGGALTKSTVTVYTEDADLYGATVTFTIAGSTQTGTFGSPGDPLVFKTKSVGTATITATTASDTATETLDLSTYKNASIEMSTVRSMLTVTTEDDNLIGGTLTFELDDETQTATIPASGEVVFTTKKTGTATVSAVNGVYTASETVAMASYDDYTVEIAAGTLYTVNLTTKEPTLYSQTITATYDTSKTKRTSFSAAGTATMKFYGYTGDVSFTSTDGTETAKRKITIVSGTDTYTAKLAFSVTYSVIIDHSKSEPTEMVTYADDAEGMTAGSSDWWDQDIFTNIRPCILSDGGTVAGYLNRDNFEQYVNGSAASLTTTGQDVMIEIGEKLGTKAEWLDNNRLKISVTNAENEDDFEYGAFSYNAKGDCDKIYIGAYLASESSSKLYSNSGKAAKATITIGTARTEATGRGTGYVQLQDAQWELLGALFAIFYKSLDSQTKVGRGYVDGNSAAINTGGSEAWGMNSELIKATNPSYQTDGKHHVKFLGIEDCWGNIRQWADGMYYDANRSILRAPYASLDNDAATGYETIVANATSQNVSGYLVRPQGVTGAMFCAKESSGSETTYYTDYANLGASCVPCVGGNWSDAGSAGVFYRNNDAVSNSSAYLGARLVYMHQAT